LPSIGLVQHVQEIRLLESVEAGGAEHICLAADEFSIDRGAGGARVGPALRITGRFRRAVSELAVLEGHRLAVHTLRSRGEEKRYVLDLRFIDGRPVVRRHWAPGYWLAGLACLAAVAVVHGVAALPAVQPVPMLVLPLELGLVLMAGAFGSLAVQRVHEAVLLQSTHGRIDLVEVLGDLGSSRAFESFAADMSRRIADARARVPQTRQLFLRDELREHRRLYEEGILSRGAYEAGKRRILESHA
jgi:hypothetical protein